MLCLQAETIAAIVDLARFALDSIKEITAVELDARLSGPYLESASGFLLVGLGNQHR
jgi:hypothetical protein